MSMKFKSLSFIVLTTLFSSVYAQEEPIRGVNYDPVHSLDFAKAVGLDDGQGMIDAINKDLDKLIELHDKGFDNIRYIKTFFSNYSSLGAHKKAVTINIADVINTWNLNHPSHAVKLALGVYEFRPNIDACTSLNTCEEWTEKQIETAIKSANQYPQLIDRIVVGNEDLTNQTRKRIIRDIGMIKKALYANSIKVGTAQIGNQVMDVFTTNKYNDLKMVADFIGANVYPYWGGVSYGVLPDTLENSPAKQNMKAYWKSINALKGNFEVIETEEGWPSQGSVTGRATPMPDFAHDYFYYWYSRKDETAPISYYFALFDKTPGQGTESHWGLYSADRNASILGTDENPDDFSKALANDHVMVRFNNLVGKEEGASRATSLLACTKDWNASTKSQGQCYPIDGYNRTGDIGEGQNRDFMIDKSGKTYESLMVIFYGDDHSGLRLCVVDKASLAKLNNQSQIDLNWKTADGAVLCDIK